MRKFKIDWCSFANWVKMNRTSMGLTVRDLESRAGMSKATISRIERGHECSAENYLNLCVWMKISPKYFLTKEPSQHLFAYKESDRGPKEA